MVRLGATCAIGAASLFSHGQNSVVPRGLIADMPAGMKLLKFKRIPKTDRAFVVVVRPESEDNQREIATTLVQVVGDDVRELGKAISVPYVFGKPTVEAVDLERDGTPEIVMIGQDGGAHALTHVSIIRATKTGLSQIKVSGVSRVFEGLVITTASEWKVRTNARTKAVELHAELSTYDLGEVASPVLGRSVTVVYAYKNGKFVKKRTIRS